MPGLISKKIYIRATLVIGILATVLILLSNVSPTRPRDTRVLWLKDIPIRIDNATTPTQRERGLGGRASLPTNHGMFFVFDHDDYHSFWMKDMHFAIDILWLDQNLTIVDMKLDAAPENYPENFIPRVPARYVLEVPAGFSRNHGVAIGDRAHF